MIMLGIPFLVPVSTAIPQEDLSVPYAYPVTGAKGGSFSGYFRLMGKVEWWRGRKCGSLNGKRCERQRLQQQTSA